MIDLIDLLRSIVCASDRAAENKNYPSPFAEGSPLLAQARQACTERGYTAAGLDVPGVTCAALPSTEECWSANEEDYNSTSLGELLDRNDHLVVGDTVWRAEATAPGARELFDANDAMEMMRDRACDIAGEYGDDYPNVSDHDVAELNALIVAWIDRNAPPSFYTVTNPQPYILTADDLDPQVVA